MNSRWRSRGRRTSVLAAAVVAGFAASYVFGGHADRAMGEPGSGAVHNDRVTLVARPYATLEQPSKADAEPFAEAPRFDRSGNLYWVSVGGDADGNRVFKLDMSTRKSVPLYRDKTSVFSGIAVDRDGSVYLADLVNGRIMRMNRDGTGMRTVVEDYHGSPVYPDDMVFDKKGNLYFTSFDGTLADPVGGVYRLQPNGALDQVTAGLARPNGISLSPEGDQIWVGELQANRVDQIGLNPDGTMDTTRFSGYPRVMANLDGSGADSNTVDSAGNVYQAELASKELVVINKLGKIIGRVALPSLPDGYKVSNVVIKPGERAGYITTGGGSGASQLYRFQALAPGTIPFSHR
ncbi:SMP-30/gluconolactonase/LRE family protein [Sciscionella marina]|uniref:SMP-30/gluconolactonase/LRE family protein n=1 Tax=Sciscionella marina TaxID=508770 RepID=UPI00036B02BA|nr:SMP-30/gluconolactonase/LRE family protein [Sciscionella marina]